jgi:dTDP-4-dehydrorhamnose 3,5-epimerase
LKAHATELPDVLVLEPEVFRDPRGFFLERYNKRAFAEATGLNVDFVQDNHSCSAQNVLRGLHYQISQPQGKLVWAVAGTVFDAAVDLRRSSPTFGKSTGFLLSAESHKIAWIPPGFAHGFLVVSKTAEILYKTTDYYAPEHERTLLWNDPNLKLNWPINPESQPILADKDLKGLSLEEAEVFS